MHRRGATDTSPALLSRYFVQSFTPYADAAQAHHAVATVEWRLYTVRKAHELASLGTKDLELQADGTVRGLIRHSKADQLGFGRSVYGSKRSGDLLAEWLEAREIETPWLFCPVRHGFAYDRPLSTSQVKNIIKAAAKAAGVEGDGSGAVSGHSLRVGAAQELMARGADIGTIMRAGG